MHVFVDIFLMNYNSSKFRHVYAWLLLDLYTNKNKVNWKNFALKRFLLIYKYPEETTHMWQDVDDCIKNINKDVFIS